MGHAYKSAISLLEVLHIDSDCPPVQNCKCPIKGSTKHVYVLTALTRHSLTILFNVSFVYNLQCVQSMNMWGEVQMPVNPVQQ